MCLEYVSLDTNTATHVDSCGTPHVGNQLATAIACGQLYSALYTFDTFQPRLSNTTGRFFERQDYLNTRKSAFHFHLFVDAPDPVIEVTKCLESLINSQDEMKSYYRFEVSHIYIYIYVCVCVCVCVCA